MFKVLVVDNSKDWLSVLTGTLRDAGYDAVGASSEREAIEEFTFETFDFAFVDVRLHGDKDDDLSGISLAGMFRYMSPTTSIYLMSAFLPTEPFHRVVRRVIKYAGNVEFIDKGSDIDQQMLNILDRAKRMLEDSQDQETHSDLFDENGTLTLDHRNDSTRQYVALAHQQAGFLRSHGRFVSAVRTQSAMNLDIDYFGRLVDDVRRDIYGGRPIQDIRFEIRRIGSELWQRVFGDHPALQKAFIRSRVNGSFTNLLFEGSRDYMRLPIEFIRMDDPDDFLVLRHPVARFINGAETQRQPISRQFLANVPKLRVLLIASNTKPDIPNVDNEIEALNQFFTRQDRVPVEIKVIRTEQATGDKFRAALRDGAYDIIHYAGHGWFDADAPEESTLSFWSKPGKKGDIVHLRATEFERLSDSEVRLVYLSSCWGSATSEQRKLQESDFLGTADAIAQAGVPSVLGYRWPVSDEGAPKLAQSFYSTLLLDGRPDVALWRARREVAFSDRNDLTWLSPILIHQV